MSDRSPCLLSVIIPVYNCLDYLDTSVRSISHALYNFSGGPRRVELVVVDDGSTDGSGERLDQMARDWAQDSRIVPLRIEHQANGGLSVARNTGIRLAHGDFLLFLDADDRFRSDFLKDLIRLLSNADNREQNLFVLSLAAFQDGTGTEGQGYGTETPEWMAQDAPRFQSSRHALSAYLRTISREEYHHFQVAVRYVVKRSFILKENLFFTEGILHEDEDWTGRLLTRAVLDEVHPKISELQPWLYAYRQGRTGSITASRTARHLSSRAEILKRQVNELDSIWRRLLTSGLSLTPDDRFQTKPEKLIEVVLRPEIPEEEVVFANYVAALSYLRGRIAHNLRSLLMFWSELPSELCPEVVADIERALEHPSNAVALNWAASETELRRWVPWIGIRGYHLLLDLGHLVKDWWRRRTVEASVEEEGTENSERRVRS